MKYALSIVLLTFVTGCSNGGSSSTAAGSPSPQGAGGLYGAYYTPRADLGSGAYQPEKLDVVDDGLVTTYEVQDGATIITSAPFTVNGNQIITAATAATQATYDCNGNSIGYGAAASPAMTLTFQRVGDTLTLEGGGYTMTWTAATAAQKAAVLNLPKCVKR